MTIFDEIPFALVVHAWLKSEWYLPQFDPFKNATNQRLIDNPNLRDENENLLRLSLLHPFRYPLIDNLPQDTVWYRASIDMEDIEKIFIMPSPDWEDISEGRYDPRVVISNLDKDSRHTAEIKQIRESLSKKEIDERIILIASTDKSVISLLDGTHRFVALLAEALEKNSGDPIFSEVFIGLSDSMKDHPSHIEKYLDFNLIKSE